jgi:hypothetical protein
LHCTAILVLLRVLQDALFLAMEVPRIWRENKLRVLKHQEERNQLEDGDVLTNPPERRQGIAERYWTGEETVLQIRNTMMAVRRHKRQGRSSIYKVREGVGLIKQRNDFQLASILPALDEILHVIDANAERFGRPETHRERAKFERRRREVKWDEKFVEVA